MDISTFKCHLQIKVSKILQFDSHATIKPNKFCIGVTQTTLKIDPILYFFSSNFALKKLPNSVLLEN